MEGISNVQSAVDRTEFRPEQWANIFGPSAYDVEPDKKRNRKYGRLHLPDALIGYNQFITDRVDGLITDATKSPFTTVILPYKWLDNPDRKLEWNVWTFDEGLASRVPYESSARTLTQRKESFSGYTVRQGLAIVMEHNFMMSEEGIRNFQNQVQQIVNSIQNTNDLDVHQALLMAPSYLNKVREQYYLDDYLFKAMQDYKDMFGFLQKNPNAMDLIIEETRSRIAEWGGVDPDFMLCSNKLCFQLTMTPEKTSYFSEGPDGKKLLKEGPMLAVYRGLKIIRSKSFSMDEGSAPRDLLRRRVRTGEMYLVPGDCSHIELYDEGSDNWHSIQERTLEAHSRGAYVALDRCSNVAQDGVGADQYLLLRPNIEHYMLGVIIGTGGLNDLGATFWGQTEMSVFDDGQHGVWGMTYKAMVINERNLHRVWDIAYDGYNGGKDVSILKWSETSDIELWKSESEQLGRDYNGKSIVVVPLDQLALEYLPSPMPYPGRKPQQSITSDLIVSNTQKLYDVFRSKCTFRGAGSFDNFQQVLETLNAKLNLVPHMQEEKHAAQAAIDNETTTCRLFYQGSVRIYDGNGVTEKIGCGHHGADYIGVASVRNGKSLMASTAPLIRTTPMISKGDKTDLQKPPVRQVMRVGDEI